MHTTRFAPGQETLPFALLRRAAELRAETGFFLAPTGPLRFFLRGPRDAPPLLLLHGMGDTGPGWAQVIPALAKTHRVHAIDLPGHGLSAAPAEWAFASLLSAVRAYATSLAAPRDGPDSRPLVVGHSLGGWLALRLLLEGGFDARGLVLVNPAGARLDPEEWTKFAALVSARDSAGAREYLRRAFHRPPPLLWLFPSEVVKVMQAEGAQALLRSLAPSDFVSAEELSQLRLPVRLVWGESDRFLPDGSFEFFRGAIPGVEAMRLPKTGHCPHLESPRMTARAILAPFH